jgi:hypothetical protein
MQWNLLARRATYPEIPNGETPYHWQRWRRKREAFSDASSWTGLIGDSPRLRPDGKPTAGGTIPDWNSLQHSRTVPAQDNFSQVFEGREQTIDPEKCGLTRAELISTDGGKHVSLL